MSGGIIRATAFSNAVAIYELRITIWGVWRLRREFGEREVFLRAVIIMTIGCHDFWYV